MPCTAMWTLRLQDVLEVLVLSGEKIERQRRLEFQIAKMLVASGFCSWSSYILDLDVWQWSCGPHAEMKNITCKRVILRSCSERNEMLQTCLDFDMQVETLCQARLSLDNTPKYVECEICQRIIQQAVGTSRQIFCCSLGHIGISRHPGSDDNLNWECAEKLATRFLSTNRPSANDCVRCEEIWNGIELCLSEASACRAMSSSSNIKYLELKWWQLLCADVLAFERDWLLLLSMLCWKRCKTRICETENTQN